MNTQINSEPDDRPEAIQHAETGAQAWRAVVHAQQGASAYHSDFYDLAGHLVDTLAAFESLARLLARQVAQYIDGQPDGQIVYDDTSTVDPGVRLHDAVLDLGHLEQSASDARRDADRFWSAISHVGIEGAPPAGGGPVEGEVSR